MSIYVILEMNCARKKHVSLVKFFQKSSEKQLCFSKNAIEVSTVLEILKFAGSK